MNELNTLHTNVISAKALITALFELNHCWPHWWELSQADIRVGERVVLTPSPDPWRQIAFDMQTRIQSPGLLAARNPQRLPPQLRDIAVGLEIADRLINAVTLASTLNGWVRQDESAYIARRLSDEVDELCPPLVSIVVKGVWHPYPVPDPEPWPITLSPLAQMAMGARFGGAAPGIGHSELSTAFNDAAKRLTNAGLSSLAPG
ncbi:hypothetical protein HNQ50_000129 [Silvimonas terrae]|uniref:Uncharacterized protein n=1 Tax=Silvimonas terrae TaxID=300266 RepID=A0A840R7V9_9NEIS|nr:hypothetical protein [Silvimonas terrae]MBB5189419.1 hypothetical protein [Silvimonas terrae]